MPSCHSVTMHFLPEDLNMTRDESFMELALMIAFPRKRKTFLPRANHFTKWRSEQFIDRFRLSKNTVKFILTLIGHKIASRTSRNNAVSAEDKLLLTLRYFATGSFQAVSADFVGVHKSTASRIIAQVSHELALLRPQFVNFPQTDEEIRHVRQQFYSIAKFPKVIGALDCTHVRIKSPGGDNAENYRNRKGYFSMNVQLICDADLRIQDIVARWPGSSHDTTIFNHSSIRGKFERNEMRDNILVGDSGYSVRSYLLIPFLDTTSRGEEIYNESQIRTRNPIERTNGVLKKRFPVLALGINLKQSSVERVIVAAAVLHNIARHFGESLPRVSRTLERAINLTMFHAPTTVQNVRNATPGTLKRDTLVRYFQSLEGSSG